MSYMNIANLWRVTNLVLVPSWGLKRWKQPLDVITPQKNKHAYIQLRRRWDFAQKALKMKGSRIVSPPPPPPPHTEKYALKPKTKHTASTGYVADITPEQQQPQLMYQSPRYTPRLKYIDLTR